MRAGPRRLRESQSRRAAVLPQAMRLLLRSQSPRAEELLAATNLLRVRPSKRRPYRAERSLVASIPRHPLRWVRAELLRMAQPRQSASPSPRVERPLAATIPPTSTSTRFRMGAQLRRGTHLLLKLSPRRVELSQEDSIPQQRRPWAKVEPQRMGLRQLLERASRKVEGLQGAMLPASRSPARTRQYRAVLSRAVSEQLREHRSRLVAHSLPVNRQPPVSPSRRVELSHLATPRRFESPSRRVVPSQVGMRQQSPASSSPSLPVGALLVERVQRHPSLFLQVGQLRAGSRPTRTSAPTSGRSALATSCSRPMARYQRPFAGRDASLALGSVARLGRGTERSGDR